MFSLLESALCLWIQVHPLWIQGLKRLVLWTQNLTLLEDQGLWIQTSVLHLSYAKAASASPLSSLLIDLKPPFLTSVLLTVVPVLSLALASLVPPLPFLYRTSCIFLDSLRICCPSVRSPKPFTVVCFSFLITVSSRISTRAGGLDWAVRTDEASTS